VASPLDVLRTLGRGPPEPLLEILRKSIPKGKGRYRAFITSDPGKPEYEDVINSQLKRTAHCECQLASLTNAKPEVRVLEVSL
jgi:hypothetical protein